MARWDRDAGGAPGPPGRGGGGGLGGARAGTERREGRRARLAELEGRDWRYGDCRACGAAGVVFAPGQEGNVLCGGCRISEASLATAISRLPANTPPPIVRAGSEQIGPEN